MEAEDISTNKVLIISRILNNLGINDLTISKKISDRISDIELKTFTLVFPIDGREPISSKQAEQELDLPTYPRNLGYKNVMNVVNSIYVETGIMVNEKNIGLIGLSEDEYEKYYTSIAGFFIRRGFSKNDVILKIMRSVTVEDFNNFLEVYEKKRLNQTQLAEETGVREQVMHIRLASVKKIIKEEAGIEVFSAKWKKTLIKPIEEYKEELKEYFIEIGIKDRLILERLLNNIKQKDFRVFVLKYPLKVEEACKREDIMQELDISLQMVKKSLSRMSETFYELGISFPNVYKTYTRKYRERSFQMNKPFLEKEENKSSKGI